MGFLIFNTRNEDLVASKTGRGMEKFSFSLSSTWETVSRDRPLTPEPRRSDSDSGGMMIMLNGPALLQYYDLGPL